MYIHCACANVPPCFQPEAGGELSLMADRTSRVAREARGKGPEPYFPYLGEIQVLEPNFIGSARRLGILYLSEKPVLLASPAVAALGAASERPTVSLR